MTNTMTPSDIIEWHDGVVEWDPAAHDYVQPTINAITAATIRELEADRDQEIRTRESAVKMMAEAEAKLKIATEALESVKEALEIEIEELSKSEQSGAQASWPMLHNAEVEIEEALARIKEGG